ncbi:MAG: hypothetical protein ACRBI6_06805 [Acidimicrobiales bacterium]
MTDRRPHPAVGARLVATGIAAGGFGAMVGSMAWAATAETATSPGETAAAAADPLALVDVDIIRRPTVRLAAPTIVTVPGAAASGTAAPGPAPAPAAPAPAATAAPAPVPAPPPPVTTAGS